MTGSSETPRAQRRVYFSNEYLLGPLSRMILSRSAVPAANAPIKAIWRNERGPVAVSQAQART